MNFREKYNSGYFKTVARWGYGLFLTKFMFKNYFSTKKSRLDYRAYEYSRYLQRRYFSVYFESALVSSLGTLCLWAWMRMVKAKGTSDAKVMSVCFLGFGFYFFNFSSVFFMREAKMPRTVEDLALRREYVRDVLFSTEISKFCFK